MRNFIKRANTKVSIGWAAALLSASYFASLILGFLRDRLLFANFGSPELGVSAETDAYLTAFTVPDFMYFLLVSGALSVTLIPVFNQRYQSGNKKSAWELASSVLNMLAIITLITSIVIIVFADPIVRQFVGRGLDPATQDLTINMMRIIAINPFLFSISSVFTSIQQAIGRFFFFAVAPITYNLGIIFGILVLSREYGIEGVAYGVALGSVIQLFVSIFGLVGMDFEYNFKIFWKNAGFRKVLKLLPARSLDQGIDYLLVLVETSVASFLIGNAISQYQSAFKLHLAPITLVGVAISTAFFPKLSERLNSGRRDLFTKELVQSLRVIIWLALPASIIAYFGRGYLVRLLFAKGNPVVASLLGILVIAIFFRSIFHILSRSFYAQQDTKTPLYISIVAIGLNIVLAVMLGQSDAMGVRGLAVAQSVVAAFEVLILVAILSKRFQGFISRELISAIARMFISGAVMSVAIYVMIRFVLPLQVADLGLASATKFLTAVTVGMLAYVASSSLLNLEESKPVSKKILNVIYRPVKVE